MEFTPWQKTSRFFREVTVTEKIDGTNSAIRFEPLDEKEFGDLVKFDGRSYREPWPGAQLDKAIGLVPYVDERVVMGAQSRKRLITPEDDNFGFADWVSTNATTLFEDLGYGIHYGEWWGHGIQRGYGMPKGLRTFSLFNTRKWGEAVFNTPGLSVVPVLYQSVFDEWSIQKTAERLHQQGSVAAPGFKPAEGVVIYFHQANIVMKYTPYENNDGHKER